MFSLFFVLTLAACDSNAPTEDVPTQDPVTVPTVPNDPKTEVPVGPELPESSVDVGFAIHFNIKTKENGEYLYDLWLWETGGEGADYDFNEEDDYGAVARYKWTDGFEGAKEAGLGFIVKTNKTWDEGASKDVDADRYIDFSALKMDKYGYYHIYLITQDKKIYTTPDLQLSAVIQDFSIAYNKVTGYKLWFQTNSPYESYQIKINNEVVYSNEIVSDNMTTKTDTKVVYSLGKELPELLYDYELTVKFKETGSTLTKVADKSVLYSTAEFDAKYTYGGELGAIYSEGSTTFRVWSPLAEKIILRVYDDGTPASLGGNDFNMAYKMTQGEKGTWEYTLYGDLSGKYYTYVVTNAQYKDAEIVDPYAKSTGINGLRGMVVNFAETNPEGWDDVQIHEYDSKELTVYETHVADLTSSSTWGGTAENAKIFKGFYETGTTYTEGDVTVSTGFDHIKELGVNAVQLIPIFDQANDERPKYRAFNWGYNPLNYNSLDGIFSSDPYNGYTKITEFKELVMAYNEAGINIIMDVVYNHVAGLEKCNFDVLMPKYYFRYNASGASNGSGCGNETASEMPMFRKFMIDSTEFWASEYKLGGYRFDLMGVHDVETMNQLTANLHENVNEHIAVYGEPWTGGTIALSGTSANQVNMNQYEGYGCFNDKMRDALIKGGLSGVSEKGWITNSSTVDGTDILNIKSGIRGLVLSSNSSIEPDKCINYVTCHDNYTLYDRIVAAGITDEATIKKMAMLSNSVVFTSQGTAFMLAGEEFLRTKGGNENSYNASYAVNELNYALKVKNLDLFENYKKLIALKQNSALFAKDGAGCKAIEIKTNANSSMIYYDIIDTVNNVTYKIIHSNGVSGTKSVNLDGYTLYLDTLNSGVSLTANTIIQGYQTIIAYKALN